MKELRVTARRQAFTDGRPAIRVDVHGYSGDLRLWTKGLDMLEEVLSHDEGLAAAALAALAKCSGVTLNPSMVKALVDG